MNAQEQGLRFAENRVGPEMAAAFAAYFADYVDSLAEGEMADIESAWADWRREIAGC